jgi:hypothetical protein
MRYSEPLEADPDYRLLRGRLEQRVNELWSGGTPDPLADAEELRQWLQSQNMTDEADRIKTSHTFLCSLRRNEQKGWHQ